MPIVGILIAKVGIVDSKKRQRYRKNVVNDWWFEIWYQRKGIIVRKGSKGVRRRNIEVKGYY